MTKILDLKVYPTRVDTKKSFAKLVADGRYDWKSDYAIASNWPIENVGVLERNLVLVHLDRTTSTDEVLAYMKEHGLTTATTEDLLAFGAQYPELQRQFPIVELGAVYVVGGRRGMLYLHGHINERSISVRWVVGNVWVVGNWDSNYRFLARK